MTAARPGAERTSPVTDALAGVPRVMKAAFHGAAMRMPRVTGDLAGRTAVDRRSARVRHGRGLDAARSARARPGRRWNGDPSGRGRHAIVVNVLPTVLTAAMVHPVNGNRNPACVNRG